MKLDKPIAVGKIAELVGADVIGDPDVIITGINVIHKAEHGDITFADHPRYIEKAAHSPASAVIVPSMPSSPNGKVYLISKDPFAAYNKLVSILTKPNLPQDCWVSPTARIARGTRLSPGVYIGEEAVIGENCIIYPNVYIAAKTVIGNGVIIGPNTTIGFDAFYYRRNQNGKYERLLSCGRVILEDNVEIGAGCTIDRGVSGDTIIGAGTKIDNQVHIGHGTVIGKNCIIAAQVGISGKVTIGDNTTIWGKVGVAPRVHIGSNVTIMAMTGVDKNLPDGGVYGGRPVRDIRQEWKEKATLSLLTKHWDRLKRLLR